MAWSVVYVTMPPAPLPIAADMPSSPPQSPLTALNSEVPLTILPPPVRAPLSSASSMNSSLPPVPVPAAPSPADSVAVPSLPVSKTPAAPVVKPPAPATNPPSASHQSAVPAEDHPTLQNISPACIVELEKLCEAAQPGEARRKCFRENENKLSPICQRQMDDMAARIKEDMQHFRTACAADVKQFCPDIQPGGGNVLQCLEENYKEVSENCYQALKHFQTRKAGRSL